MGIDFSGADRAMPQYSLDIPDINILFQQESGKGVPEHMGRQVLFDVGKLGIAVNHEADGLIR